MNHTEAFNYEPDKLAERFLIEFYAWHLQMDNPPEQYLDARQTDWKLRWWRGCTVFNYYKFAEGQRKIHQVRFQQNTQIEFFVWTYLTKPSHTP